MPTSSQWLTINSPDGPFQAYLALPHGGRGGPGIVLLQEIFGVNEHIRAVADQYAADGYVVLAPDLFWRQGPRIELGYADADWQRAVALMKACDVALARADIALAAAALRARPGVGANIAALGFCFGGRLSFLAACDGVEIHLYPQAEHGFNCDHRAGYQQRAAAQAHGNSLLFLAERLSPAAPAAARPAPARRLAAASRGRPARSAWRTTRRASASRSAARRRRRSG